MLMLPSEGIAALSASWQFGDALAADGICISAGMLAAKAGAQQGIIAAANASLPDSRATIITSWSSLRMAFYR